MRFDEHRGLMPSSLRIQNGSLRGTLVRTKISGSGRKKESFYMFVASSAWLVNEQWLPVGLGLWLGWGTERDYFPMLPSPDLQRYVAHEARCSDSQTMSGALIGLLRTPSGERLLTVSCAAGFGRSILAVLG